MSDPSQTVATSASNVDALAATITSVVGAAANSAPISAAAPAVGQTASDVVTSVTDVKTTSGTLQQVEEGISDAANVAGDMLGTLSQLHLVNTQLAERGTSIAEIVAAVAKAFLGIHL